jgi:hypothetical protein
VTSAINYLSINENFPVAGQDNDTQVFRDNFDTIKTSLRVAGEEVTALQNTSARLDSDNDFGLNVVQNAVLQNVREQKWDGGVASVSPTTIDFQNGSYQIYSLNADINMDLLNFPGDDSIVPAADSLVGVGRVTLELYSDSTGTAITAGSFTVDDSYVITTEGDTDFTLIGADDNTVGTVFTATGAGTGTGTATLVRILGFQTSGTTVIKTDSAFPSQIVIDSSTDPIFIEIWRHTTETIYMRYLGKFN